jgi:hypothetical protein
VLLPPKIGAPVDNPEVEGYLPFPVAMEKGVIDLSRVNPVSPQQAVAEIFNYRMPEAAGVVDLGSEIGAYDLVAGHFSGSRLEVAPLAKDAVDDRTDQIQDEGLVTLTRGSLLRVVGIMEPARKAPLDYRHLPAASLVLRTLCSLDGTDFEITEINLDNGLVTAKPRVTYF